MPRESIPHETLPLQGVSPSQGELHEGDLVRVTKGQYYHRTGTIERIGHSTGLLIDSVSLYIVRLSVGPLVFLRDEIERVESEVGNA